MTELVAQLTELRRRFPQLRPRHWVDGRRAGRLLRRAVADAAGDRDDRGGLEFSGRPLPLLRARPDRGRTAAAVHRAQCRAAKRSSSRCRRCRNAARWTHGARTRRAAATSTGSTLPRGREVAGAGALGPGVCRRGMNATTQLRPASCIADGVTFRLWAPAAKRVELMLDRAHADAARAATAGTSSTIAGAGAGTRYKFRIDGELEVPDPGFALPAARMCRARARSSITRHSPGRRATGAAGPGTTRRSSSCMSARSRPAGTFRAAIDKLDHVVETGFTAIELMPLADFAGRRNWGYDGVLLVCARQRLRPAGRSQGADRRRASARPDGVSRRRLQPLRAGGELSRPLRAGVLHRGADALGRGDRLSRAARCAPSRSRMRCIGCEHYRFDGLRLDAVHAIVEPGEPLGAGRAEPRGRADSRAETGRHIHLVLENDDNTREPARSAQRSAARANIARNGTTTIITPGTCC